MKTIVIRDLKNGVLIPLPALVDRLPQVKVSYWIFREVHFQHGRPFGLSIDDFERLTRDLKGGFMVADEDFREFLKSDFQMIDGVVDAVDGSGVLMSIDCEDATQWEVSTNRTELIPLLDKAPMAGTGS